MKKLPTYSYSFPNHVKWVNHLLLTFKTCVFIFLILSSTKSFGQTFPSASSCTSKDLELVRAELNNGDVCGSCTPGTQITNRHLIGYINNKTGSTRTSFAFWGTLVLTNPDGSTVTRTISRCKGPIPKNAITPIDFDTIQYTCGQSLKLINLFLAWTSASPGETCPLNSALIAPKCGTLPSIIVVAGLNADITKADATCNAGGSISVSPIGGTAPYSVTVNGVTKSIAAGGTGTFNNLAASSIPYTIYITDATLPTHCTNNANSRTIGSASAVTANAGTDFTITCTQNVGGLTIGEPTSTDFTYSWSPSNGLSSSTSSNPNANPSSTTTYTVTKTNIATGCTDDDDVIVTVNKPTVIANAGADFTKTCVTNPGGAQIGEASASDFSYSWSPATGLSNASISNPIANPSSTTAYTVTKTHTASGCTDDDDVIVTVNKPTVTANAGADFTKTCVTNPGGAQIGEASASDFGYSWSPATGLSDASISNPIANPSSTTTYTVTKTHTASGCTDDDDVTVTVSTAAPTFTVCLVQPDLCTQYGNVTVNASGSNLMYKLNSGSPQSSNVFNNLGSGSVTSITVIGDNGCSTTVNCADLVQDCSSAGRAAISTPVNSESSEAQTTVKAYPNPFSDKVKFVVSSSVAGDGNLEVYNMMGQKIKTVYTGFIAAGSQTFELSLPTQQVSTLVYVLRIGGKQISGKLLQQGNR